MIKYSHPRGITRIETAMILLLVLLAGGAAYVALGGARSSARKMTCQKNLMALSMVCHLYSDTSENNSMFPDDGKGACGSVNLLYDRYAKDYRLWVCPASSTGVPTSKLRSSVEGGNLSRELTNYGYDRRHKPADSNALLMSEMGSSACPGSNSHNHERNGGDDLGQNVTDVSGQGYWMDSTLFKQSIIPNDDIFRDDSATPGATAGQDSWIKND